MTVERPLWLNGLTDYTADEFRAALDATYASPGVIGSASLAVTPDSPVSMNVKVATGYSIVPGKVGAARKYLLHVSAIHTVPINAAHATLSRTDNIVAEIDDTQASDGSDAALVYSVPGTPGGAAAAVAANQILLAQVVVGPAVATIVSGNITDKRSLTSPRAMAGRVFATRNANIAASSYIDSMVPPSSFWHTRSTGGYPNDKLTLNVDCIVSLDADMDFASTTGTSGGLVLKVLSAQGDTTSYYVSVNGGVEGQHLGSSVHWCQAMKAGEMLELYGRSVNVSAVSNTLVHITFIPCDIQQ